MFRIFALSIAIATSACVQDQRLRQRVSDLEAKVAVLYDGLDIDSGFYVEIDTTVIRASVLLAN